MKVVGLDISTKPGWAVMTDALLEKFGSFKLDKPVIAFGEYPWSYDKASDEIAEKLHQIVLTEKPDVIVIEETNLGKSRYAQKTLEFIHKALLFRLRSFAGKVIYLSSSEWRRSLKISMSKEDKRSNAKLSKAKNQAKETGIGLDKKSLGIRGKVTKKHLALRYVNSTFGLNLKVKDNDAADAICLTAAYFAGATPCDGVM